MRDPRFDVLFEPIQIGPKTLRNRFYAPPQCSGFGSDRPGAQAHHRAMKAAGGFAVVHTEWCAIHPEADEWPAVTGRLWTGEDAHNLSLMTELIHEHGGLAGVQLGFNGNHSENLETRIAARGVTQVPSNTFVFHSCYEMTKVEIRELQGWYAAAAVRARDVGFDVVNICVNENAGIPQQFLMNAYNRRGDEYGGSLENRMRFLRETLELVREAVADACAVTVRLAIDTAHGTDAGMRADVEGVAVVQALDHLVDLWDLEVTGRSMAEWGDAAGPSRFFEEGYQLWAVEKVRPYTRTPIVNVGRFVDPYAMVRAIEHGPLDLIGLARPGIADPFIPEKIRTGRTDEIRECIGCNICISRYEQKASIVCTQNPTIGEEYRRGWHPEQHAPSKRSEESVLVVGAGPAGMECASVLGQRGTSYVHLADAERRMGGSLRWVSQLPGLGEWARVIHHREVIIGKHRNVTFVPGTRLDAEAILDYGADVVVVANGSHWARDGLNGPTHGTIPGADASLLHVLTPEQIMVEGAVPPGRRVLVYDCEGYFMAASLAEKFAREGMDVTAVTPFAELGPYMHYTLELPRMQRLLHELGVKVLPHHVVDAIEPGLVRGRHVYAERTPIDWDVDSVVLCTQRLSDDHLYRELESMPDRLEEAGIRALHRIGDCVVPRITAEVIFEGHRLAREIDEENPAVPLPFIRERRVLGHSDADYDRVVGDRGIEWTPRSGPASGLRVGP